MTDLEEMFTDLLGCCLHDPQWKPEDVASEIRWVGPRAAENDSSSIVIVRLNQGGYGLLTQSADYTGHGCQCNAMTVRSDLLGKLLTHLDDWELLALLA